MYNFGFGIPYFKNEVLCLISHFARVFFFLNELIKINDIPLDDRNTHLKIHM